jgi:hypothetical protein
LSKCSNRSHKSQKHTATYVIAFLPTVWTEKV